MSQLFSTSVVKEVHFGSSGSNVATCSKGSTLWQLLASLHTGNPVPKDMLTRVVNGLVALSFLKTSGTFYCTCWYVMSSPALYILVFAGRSIEVDVLRVKVGGLHR